MASCPSRCEVPVAGASRPGAESAVPSAYIRASIDASTWYGLTATSPAVASPKARGLQSTSFDLLLPSSAATDAP